MQEHDLLKPSLSQGNAQQPIYSVGALIAAAFFGGALAAPVIAFENARRQKRLGKDMLWLALATFAALGVLYVAIAHQVQSVEFDDRFIRVVNRAAGFGLAGLFYLLHRAAYRTQRFTGIDNPTPYAIVILAVLLGAGATAVLMPLLKEIAAGGGL